MTATFDASLSTAKDRLRFALGDTDVTQPAAQDETYVAVLALNAADEQLAAIQMADSLILRYAQLPDVVDVDGAIKVSWKDRIPAWEQLAARLRAITGAPGGASTYIQGGDLTNVGSLLTPWTPV